MERSSRRGLFLQQESKESKAVQKTYRKTYLLQQISITHMFDGITETGMKLLHIKRWQHIEEHQERAREAKDQLFISKEESNDQKIRSDFFCQRVV